MRIFIQRYAENVVRFRWFVLLFTLLVTVGLASRAVTLKTDNNPDLWTPMNNEFIKTNHDLEKIFGGRNFTVIGVVPKHGDIYTPSVLNKIRHIQTAVEAIPEAIKHNIISLAAKRVKDIQGNSEGMVVRELLEPMPQTRTEMDVLRSAISRNPVYLNALVSPDGKAAAIVADFRIPLENATYTPLYLTLKKITDRERDANTDILLGGQTIEAANLEFAMQKMQLYFGVAFLIIMTIQFFAFRSLQGMLLPMVTAILSVLWGLGILSLAGINMDALNTTTPILIMAVATGHAVQVLKRYYEELNIQLIGLPPNNLNNSVSLCNANHQAVIRSLTGVGPVMLTASLIAALAFFSMQASDVAMIRHFGFFAGIGILAILCIEFDFTPALRAILPASTRQMHRVDAVDTLLGRIGNMLAIPGASHIILLVAALVIILIGFGATRVLVDNSVKQYSDPNSLIRKDSAILNDRFGGTDSMFFLIEGQSQDAIKNPQVLWAMAKLQTFLESQPNIGKTQSLADLIRRMNLAMHGENKKYNVIPQNRNLIAQYLLLYSLSGQPQDLDNFVDANYQRTVVWTYLKTDSTSYAEQLWQKCQQLIQKEFPHSVTVRVGGGLPELIATNNSLVSSKIFNMAQMAIVVFLLSSLALSSLVGGLLVVAPLAAIVLSNFGLMGWFGIPLDMGTATTAAMVTGIGADYEIYMLYRLREEYAKTGDLNVALRTSLQTSGRAVLFVALSIAGGYSALLLSDFRFYPRLGITMIATMIACALLSLLLLRAIIILFKPKFITNCYKFDH